MIQVLTAPFADPFSMFNPPWWFDAAVQVATTVLSVGVGVWLVMLQLGRQHKAALEQQRAQARLQLHKEIHKDITDRLHEVGESVTTLNISTLTLASLLRIMRESIDKYGRQYFAPGNYPPERLIREHDDAMKDLISVSQVLEDYEIALKGLDEMRVKYGRKINEISPRWNDYYQKVLPFLPTPSIGLPGHQAPTPPSTAQVDEIQKAAEGLMQLLYDLLGFIFDLRVAAQNHLLKDLFPGSRAKDRQPDDPRVELLRPSKAPER